MKTENKTKIPKTTQCPTCELLNKLFDQVKTTRLLQKEYFIARRKGAFAKDILAKCKQEEKVLDAMVEEIDKQIS
jgi:hypothetical protein